MSQRALPSLPVRWTSRPASGLNEQARARSRHSAGSGSWRSGRNEAGQTGALESRTGCPKFQSEDRGLTSAIQSFSGDAALSEALPPSRIRPRRPSSTRPQARYSRRRFVAVPCPKGRVIFRLARITRTRHFDLPGGEAWRNQPPGRVALRWGAEDGPEITSALFCARLHARRRRGWGAGPERLCGGTQVVPDRPSPSCAREMRGSRTRRKGVEILVSNDAGRNGLLAENSSKLPSG